jgi:membrane-associated phospholipid phosphatase
LVAPVQTIVAKDRPTQNLPAGNLTRNWKPKTKTKAIMQFKTVLLCAGLLAQVINTRSASNDEERHSASDGTAQSANPVVQWNKTLLAIVRTHGAQPPTIHPTRSFAILHAAIYDAVNAIDRSHTPYLLDWRAAKSTSVDAAVAGAAHEVLLQLYPAFQATLDSQYEQSLAQITDSKSNAGVVLGQQAADLILAARSADGSGMKPPAYSFGSRPGEYQSTPPNFPPQPQFTEWPDVMPFALERANQFRPGPPPSLTSDAYTDAFNEVKAFGVLNGTASSPDQALTGKFWNGAIQNYWNEIAQTAVLSRALNTAQSARLFALLNLAVADSVIAFYDGKYTYNFWRPVTAIRVADTDDNPETLADANWLPEVGNTTPDPSYPGAHAVVSAAASAVLISVLHHDHFAFNVTSEVLPGVERSFDSFSAAAQEATLSRIFAGVHFRFDLTAGQALGSDVADFVLEHFLTPLHQNRDGDEDADWEHTDHRKHR